VLTAFDVIQNTDSRTLSEQSESGQGSLVFETVFLIVWLGAGIIAINGQLLGGKISFF
jgi:hypothetical protein